MVRSFEESRKSGQADQSRNTGEWHGTGISWCIDFVAAGCIVVSRELVQLALVWVETLFNSPANIGTDLFALFDDADLDTIGNIGAWMTPLNADIVLNRIISQTLSRYFRLRN